ncbi:two-component sensor histidine kinase [Melghirimyces profundicolus]|uniref:histidine kinase n=1 Tax=Melghirimyces profundicolus TaxID=1242148 RepID=A0A2T6C8K3_9BACL|nr:sensor histidine kinase [Melghirimyces profundicolus]PTX64651.1 two-component sensor histidine kinase [Melghirimyces profundicolus]
MKPTLQILQEKTGLERADIEELTKVTTQLQLMADLYGADIFLDCLVRGRSDQAVVVAEAKPRTSRSLYTESFTGKLILKDNEPGVFAAFQTGKYITGTRAITNEKVTVEQKVLPVFRDDKVIGVLILEQDISNQIRQEKKLRRIRKTAEDLSETLWEVTVAETDLPTLIQEGVILCNEEGLFSYVNPKAREMLKELDQPIPQIGTPLSAFCFGVFDSVVADAQAKGVSREELQFDENAMSIKAISVQKKNRFKGVVLLLRDITELRKKEKQLRIQSTVIREIHHRVKNNLQTISSLLQLQLRRVQSEENRKVFQDTINRIRSIALVHETLSQKGIEFVELNGLMERVVSMIVHTMSPPEKKINFKVYGVKVVLPSNKAIAVALILNELIQNCLDHAFVNQNEGYIEVIVQKEKDCLNIGVRDNGCGFDPKNHSGHTLGTRIVTTLVEKELNGHLEYINSDGTQVNFSFKHSS